MVYSEQKIPLSRPFAINLKNAGPIFFKILPMANAIHFNLLFPFAVFLFCSSTVYVVIAMFYSTLNLGILGVMKIFIFLCDIL